MLSVGDAQRARAKRAPFRISNFELRISDRTLPAQGKSEIRIPNSEIRSRRVSTDLARIAVGVAVNGNCYGDVNNYGCGSQPPGICHGQFGGESMLYPQTRQAPWRRLHIPSGPALGYNSGLPYGGGEAVSSDDRAQGGMERIGIQGGLELLMAPNEAACGA